MSGVDEQPGFRRYLDAAQYREEIWNELKHVTSSLERATQNGGVDLEQLRRRTFEALGLLDELEGYWAFPGRRTSDQLRRLAERSWHSSLARQTDRIVRLLVSDAYRQRNLNDIFSEHFRDGEQRVEDGDVVGRSEPRPYFEVLVVDDAGPVESEELRRRLLGMRREDDQFVYDVVIVRSFEDAVIAALFNHNIQTAILRYRFPYESSVQAPELRYYAQLVPRHVTREYAEREPSAALAQALHWLRPELDLFLVTDDPIANVAGHTGRDFRRIFYHLEDYLELHLSVLQGINDRYETPFFDALREYSQKPTGVFHAMPISRGKSLAKSHWIGDMASFYGANIFLAETSATTGGLDSLLQPHGPIRKAQEKMSRAFGSRHSYFSTNGTSTANKIVMQALIQPGDIVLVSRDCHKSHHYSLVLSGGHPVYLDPYPLASYSMYGAVTIEAIKTKLLALRAAGKLDRVRMLLLTSCTFDGLVYDPLRVMREVLAIKPDMVFVWDEAWFAFAGFSPTYRERTAMFAARELAARLRSPEYRERYAEWKRGFDAAGGGDAAWMADGLQPDPDLARVRVYATQSTHKTLTALRQGSMMHVFDQDFEKGTARCFDEAFMTHTSTSPNYQILASLDVGRRQVELEGYELVKESVQLAMTLRERIIEHPVLRRYFQVLSVKDLIPERYRPSGLEAYYSTNDGFQRMEKAWDQDEFTLDPTRVTVCVGKTGMDGDTLRKLLHDRHDIQINKTSRNTLLFMLNIGTTRGTVAYLLDVLIRIAREIDDDYEEQGELDAAIDRQRVALLTETQPPMPDFSAFHPRFGSSSDGDTPEGDLRAAFFLAYADANCEYVPIAEEMDAAFASGRPLVSASFVTPYPPGFPVLVPGQVVSREIVNYLRALDVKEIHGYEPDHGLRIFRQEVLSSVGPRGEAG